MIVQVRLYWAWTKDSEYGIDLGESATADILCLLAMEQDQTT